MFTEWMIVATVHLGVASGAVAGLCGHPQPASPARCASSSVGAVACLGVTD